MSTLKKKTGFLLIKPGDIGSPGRNAVPAQEGYWAYKEVTYRKAVDSNDIGDARDVATTGLNGTQIIAIPSLEIDGDQAILKCDMLTLYYNSSMISGSLHGMMKDVYASLEIVTDSTPVDDPEYIKYLERFERYSAEATRILEVEVASGTLGRPLAYLGKSWGADAYIAAWDGGNGTAAGVWFYTFQGFNPANRPTQRIVR